MALLSNLRRGSRHLQKERKVASGRDVYPEGSAMTLSSTHLILCDLLLFMLFLCYGSGLVSVSRMAFHTSSFRPTESREPTVAISRRISKWWPYETTMQLETYSCPFPPSSLHETYVEVKPNYPQIFQGETRLLGICLWPGS